MMLVTLGGSRDEWSMVVGKEQTDKPCIKILVMEGLFSRYWESKSLWNRRERKRGTEREREEEKGERNRKLPLQKNSRQGERKGTFFASVDGMGTVSVWSLSLKWTKYPNDRAGQHKIHNTHITLTLWHT